MRSVSAAGAAKADTGSVTGAARAAVGRSGKAAAPVMTLRDRPLLPTYRNRSALVTLDHVEHNAKA